MRPKQILLVEDNEIHRRLVMRAFSQYTIDYQITAVATLREARAVLDEQTPDLLITDVQLPDGKGSALLPPDGESVSYPIIIMTGFGDEQTAVDLIKAGALDYIVKSENTLADMPQITQRVLREWDNLTWRRQAEIALQQQGEILQKIFDHIPVMIVFLDENGQFKLVNREWERVLGWSLTDLRQMESVATNLFAKESERQKAVRLLQSSVPMQQELKTRTRNGRLIDTIWSSVPLSDGTRITIGQDVSEQVRVKKEIQHQERIASVGRLAAGIAHDFNNILSSVTLYTDLMLRLPDTTDRLEKYLRVISRQTHRATDLIQQILDFSRSTPLAQGPLNLRQILVELVSLLQRTFPENIDIQLHYEQNEFTIRADPQRIHQLFLNLALNARDAMPGGGKLTFSLQKFVLAPDAAPPFPQMAAGEWVKTAVTDTGAGIGTAALDYIFDPFFTTKESGRGTGLGLSQAHGIVHQHGGAIGVETSQPGHTTFVIYLPLVAVAANAELTADLERLPTGQGELILVVEDDALTQEALVDSLQRLNYRVTTAVNGRDALAQLADDTLPIALILSDLVMPDVGGRALLQAVQQQETAVPVVLMSGYSPTTPLDQLRAEGMADWLPKPPTMAQLAQTIHSILGEFA